MHCFTLFQGFIYNYGMDTVNQEAVTAWLDRIVKNEATPWSELQSLRMWEYI